MLKLSLQPLPPVCGKNQLTLGVCEEWVFMVLPLFQDIGQEFKLDCIQVCCHHLPFYSLYVEITLQLDYVQAANQVSLVKRVYSNLTTLWKVFS